MDFISDIVKAFRRPDDIQAHIRNQQQLIPILAVQDNLLKQTIKSFTSSAIFSQGVVEIQNMKKCRGKYARWKRKLTLLKRQYTGQSLKKGKRVLYYIKILSKVVQETNIRTPEVHQKIQSKFIFSIYTWHNT